MLSSLQYRRIWKTAFLPIMDFGMLCLAASVSYWLRYKVLQENFDGIKKVYGLDFLLASLILSLLVVLIYAILGLYSIKKRNKWSQVILKIFLGIWLVLLTTITFLFFNEYNRETLPNGVVISRFILGIVGFLAFFGVILGRFLFWSLEQILYLFGFFGVQIAIIGQNEMLNQANSEFLKANLKKDLKQDQKRESSKFENSSYKLFGRSKKNQVKNQNIHAEIYQKISEKIGKEEKNSEKIGKEEKNSEKIGKKFEKLEKSLAKKLEIGLSPKKPKSKILQLKNLENEPKIQVEKAENESENQFENQTENENIIFSRKILKNAKNLTKNLQTFLKKRHDIAKIINCENLNEKNLEFLRSQIRQGKLAEIYLFGSDNSAQIELEIELAAMAEKHKVSFIFCPSGLGIFQSFGLQSVFLENHHFFELIHSRLLGWQIVFKRLFDLVFSLSFLVFFAWLYAIIAILIKLESSGSVFYQSDRIGPNGQIFKLWKFRRLKTEYCTSETNPKSLDLEQKIIQEQGENANRGALYKIKNDPRSTKVGLFLEKTSLDEIPQFINVLIGNMSIVGPRPHQPREVSKYLPHHYKVLNIQPGITGMAQINGRSDLSFEEEVRLDTIYVEKWSFWLDLWIILKTPIVLIFKKHK